MSHHRNLAFHSHARNYSGGDDGEYSPTNNDSRSDRGDKKPRKRNSVAVSSLIGPIYLRRAIVINTNLAI